MTYAGLELFMEKLKLMIDCNGNPLINKILAQENNKQNHPSISSKIQLLYEELESVIQILFVDKENNLPELQQVGYLKKKFTDVAQEAHDLVDRFVSDINVTNIISSGRSRAFEISLNLEDVMRSVRSIKEDVISIRNNMKMDSSATTEPLKTESSAADGNCIGKKKVWDDIIVGFDHDMELIRDKLVEDQLQLDVVSIVGMGGLGKTTLATKVFNDPFVLYHFQVREWVTVSQTYEKQDLLFQLLRSIGIESYSVNNSYSRLREMLYKSLKFQRYLIVIDDIWNTEAWDDLKLFFPNDNTGSRILLTSRLNEVASHAKSNGLVHQLSYLSEEESWELLCNKVFHGDDCPNGLIGTGRRIAKNCHGLPLALVVIAGVLAKEGASKVSWKRIAQTVTSYVVSDGNWYIETLALSINGLPSHLRDCFLYLGGFPEDFKFKISRLIWLWIAEGFIHEAENQNFEKTAEDYLMELAERNLVVVVDRKCNGLIKTCSVHDVLRELCLEIATKERFCLKIPEKSKISVPCEVASYKKQRIFAHCNMGITNATNIRSFVSFYQYTRTDYCIIKFYHPWMLLMVLDVQHTQLSSITKEISLLVHLRYLAILFNGEFPSSVCNLWSLQTLIIRSYYKKILVLPNTISNLVNLRHLWCPVDILLFPHVQIQMNLQTISHVVLGDGPQRWVINFPGIKKLLATIHEDMDCDFKSLTFLETLNISWSYLSKDIKAHSKLRYQLHDVSFPASLKKLTLANCRLPWRYM